MYADSYQAWRSGSADQLNGKALTWICFLSSDEALWTAEEEKDVLLKVEEAQQWLVNQAKKYEIPLEFQISSNKLIDRHLVDKINHNQDDLIERTNILFQIHKKMGFTRRYNLLDLMKDSTFCNKLHCLVFVKGKGASYSLPFREGMNTNKYFNEGSIIFTQYESGKNLVTASIAHELLHLYGTWDLYQTFAQTADREKKAKELFPHSIMLKTYTNMQENDLDELSAWLIGWKSDEEVWYSWFKPKNF